MRGGSARANTSDCAVRVLPSVLVLDDGVGSKRLLEGLREGIFRPWAELGRAPTPNEIAARLHLDPQATSALLGELARCGKSQPFGLRFTPGATALALAWPFSAAPTEIRVTVEGGRTVFASGAIDAFAISWILEKRVTIEAKTRDGGASVHLALDGARLVAADLPNAVVFRSKDGEDVPLFSSEAAFNLWKKSHPLVEGELLELSAALNRVAAYYAPFLHPTSR